MSEETIRISLEEELDAFFGQYTGANQARGLVYALTTSEGLSHARGFGAANEDGLVPDADTVFPIASMSKSFVACAALVARDAGCLSLTDPITRYVPEFTMAGDNVVAENPPTLEMLLSMCGGLTEDNAWVDPFIGMPTRTLIEHISRGVRFSHLPGAVYEYSNLGFALCGLAIARAVEQPLEVFVREAVIGPLGLEATFFDRTVPEDVRRAIGYSLDGRGDWVSYAPQVSDAFSAAGGIVSTVRDLARWITWLGSALRTSPRNEAQPVLSRASRRELQRQHVSCPPAISVGTAGALQIVQGGYGLGLHIADDLHRGTVVSHAGGLPGFKLFMTWHPASGRGAVVLTNSHRGDPSSLCVEALGRSLARDGAPADTVRLWPETIALQERVDGLVREWDDAIAAEVFAPNVEFDRPLSKRRQEIERMIAEIGPLGDVGARRDVVSTVTPADITWSIPGQRGELLCMIHLTPFVPAQVQELVVRAFPVHRPRVARPLDISPRRAQLGPAFVSPIENVRVEFPVSGSENGPSVA
ncbi:MAG: serine hydrolase [Actinomycetota bacterium]|nr:serine hydrolase [Actinomycetota bacterium]